MVGKLQHRTQFKTYHLGNRSMASVSLKQHTLLLHFPSPFLAPPSCPGRQCSFRIQTQRLVVLALLSQIIFCHWSLLSFLLPFPKSLYRSSSKLQIYLSVLTCCVPTEYQLASLDPVFSLIWPPCPQSDINSRGTADVTTMPVERSALQLYFSMAVGCVKPPHRTVGRYFSNKCSSQMCQYLNRDLDRNIKPFYILKLRHLK